MGFSDFVASLEAKDAKVMRVFSRRGGEYYTAHGKNAEVCQRPVCPLFIRSSSSLPNVLVAYETCANSSAHGLTTSLDICTRLVSRQASRSSVRRG
jgi:hypothetical protein